MNIASAAKRIKYFISTSIFFKVSDAFLFVLLGLIIGLIYSIAELHAIAELLNKSGQGVYSK